jgi:uncharacterized protein YidB (DUF937 family)
MGLLDMLAGGRTQQRGGVSPMTLALLALLAYRTYQGKGRLADMLGRNQPGGTTNPGGRVTAPETVPTGAPPGQGGGLGDILGDLFRGGATARPPLAPGAPQSGGLGDLLRGGMGGLLGGAAAGALLNGGLGDLVRRFQQNGYGATADSWVSRGPNREMAPDELEKALGRDTLEQLSAETGRPYGDVVSELTETLPDSVDQLTPEGRLPTEDEAAQWV